MSDPFGRLTPANKLDRDALLFAAGKASARAGRGWKLACLVLVAGHMAWAVAWRDRAPTVERVVVTPSAVELPPVAVPDPVSDPPSRTAGVEGFRRRIELPPLSAPSADPAPSGPILTAGTDPRTLSLFN